MVPRLLSSIGSLGSSLIGGSNSSLIFTRGSSFLALGSISPRMLLEIKAGIVGSGSFSGSSSSSSSSASGSAHFTLKKRGFSFSGSGSFSDSFSSVSSSLSSFSDCSWESSILSSAFSTVSSSLTSSLLVSAHLMLKISPPDSFSGVLRLLDVVECGDFSFVEGTGDLEGDFPLVGVVDGLSLSFWPLLRLVVLFSASFSSTSSSSLKLR